MNQGTLTPSISRPTDYFSIGITISLGAHLFLLLVIILGGLLNFNDFSEPVVYSISLEGGKSIGGMSQVPKDDAKSQQAPPKNVQEAPKASQREEDDKDAEVALQEEKKKEEAKKKLDAEKKKQQEEEKKKKADEEKKKKAEEEKKKAEKKAKEQEAQLDKNYQSAVQRYLGESSDAGGKGFGAAKLGGNAMGGGVVRPPEFFIYKKVLEEHIKSGWRWHDVSAALVAQVIIDIEADGKIKSVTLERASGNAEYDDSVVRAIKKASPVPRPPDTVYEWFKSVRMTFDPRE